MRTSPFRSATDESAYQRRLARRRRTSASDLPGGKANSASMVAQNTRSGSSAKPGRA